MTESIQSSATNLQQPASGVQKGHGHHHHKGGGEENSQVSALLKEVQSGQITADQANTQFQKIAQNSQGQKLPTQGQFDQMLSKMSSGSSPSSSTASTAGAPSPWSA